MTEWEKIDPGLCSDTKYSKEVGKWLLDIDYFELQWNFTAYNTVWRSELRVCLGYKHLSEKEVLALANKLVEAL